MWRRHQREFDEFAQRAECGTRVRLIVAPVTPGGGKSALPVIMGHHLLRRNVIDKICWVVPNNHLRIQGEQAPTKPWIRSLLGTDIQFNAAGNIINPDRGLDGYVVNYQAIVEEPDLHRQYFEKYRVGLVLDECQHIAEGGVWHRKLVSLFERAQVRLLMSGTLERHDQSRIAFLNYGPPERGKSPLVLRRTAEQAVFRYDWQDALQERAIIHLDFHHLDGNATWRHRNGDVISVDALSEADDNTRAALFTVIHVNYATQLLNAAVNHFLRTKLKNRFAKFLCIAPSIALARKYRTILVRDLGLEKCDIATSDNPEQAVRNIERLKGNQKPELDALVTVQMTYEGMDVPSITHEAFLTHIRSTPWIHQAISRAIRVDDAAGPYESQRAHIFAPDDALLADCIAQIRAAQAPFAVETQSSTSTRPASRDINDTIVPMEGDHTSTRISDFETGEEIPPDETQILEDAMREAGLEGVSATAAQRFFEIYWDKRAQARSDENDEQHSYDEPTPSQRRDRLKKYIVRAIGDFAKHDGEEIHRLNSRLIARFNKSRDDMTEEELRFLWDHIWTILQQL